MRFYPLFLGTFFFCCLLVTIPIFYDYVVVRQIFERECGRPVEEYLCLKDRKESAADCTKQDADFQGAEAELLKLFAFSPPIVRKTTCGLNQINVIRYLSDKPGKLAHRTGEIDVSWSILKDWDFMFADRALWAHTGYKFKDIYVKYKDRRKMWITYERIEDTDGLYNLGFAAAYYHEIAKEIADLYLPKGVAHCSAKKEFPLECTSPAMLAQGGSHLDYDQDDAFTRRYDICTPKNQFAQAFSAILLRELMAEPYKVWLDTDLVLDQQKLIETAQFNAFAPIVNALRAIDGSQASFGTFQSDYLSCSGSLTRN